MVQPVPVGTDPETLFVVVDGTTLTTQRVLCDTGDGRPRSYELAASMWPTGWRSRTTA